MNKIVTGVTPSDLQLKEPLATAVAAIDAVFARENERRNALFDNFRGPNATLVECIRALVMMDVEGKVVPHGIGEHARVLLASAARRLELVEPADVDGKTAASDPMLAYYRDWCRLQALKSGGRDDLVRDAYLSGAAQGELLARTTSVTLRVPLVDESADLHGKQVDETAEMHGLTTSDAILAELVALKDLKDEEARRRQRRECSVFRQPNSLGEVSEMRDDYNRRKPLAWAAARAFLATAMPEPDQRLLNLQIWLVCREIGNALKPALSTVQGWVAALSPITGEPAPDFLMQASDPAEVSPTVALCIEQLDLWSGRLEAAIDRTAHEQLGQHANDEPSAGGRDPMEQLP